MNTIAFKLISFDDEADQDHLVVQTLIDGTPLVDFEAFATDLHEVEQSITRPGAAFILTCWCGVAGCVGLRDAIAVYHEGVTIRWRIPRPLPEQTLIFDRSQYRAAYNLCITQGNQRIANRRYTTPKPFSITPKRNSSYFKLLQK